MLPDAWQPPSGAPFPDPAWIPPPPGCCPWFTPALAQRALGDPSARMVEPPRLMALLSHLGLTAPSLPPVWLPGTLRHTHTRAFTHAHTALTHAHTPMDKHIHAPCCSRAPLQSSQEGPHLHQHPEAPSVLSSPEGSPLLGVSPPPWGSSPTRPPWSLSRALSKPTCPGPTAGPAWTLHFLLDCLLSGLGAWGQRGGGGGCPLQPPEM